MGVQSSRGCPPEDKICQQYQRIDQLLSAKIASSKQPAYDSSNKEVAQKLHEMQIASLNQRIAYYDDYISLYHWEMTASSVILWLTVVVVVCGLVFSGMQLWHAMKVGQNTDGTWEISATGMKITSAVVGLIVLAMSIAFVYLFLDRVYPVK
jgi:hypothetical protein